MPTSFLQTLPPVPCIPIPISIDEAQTIPDEAPPPRLRMFSGRLCSEGEILAAARRLQQRYRRLSASAPFLMHCDSAAAPLSPYVGWEIYPGLPASPRIIGGYLYFARFRPASMGGEIAADYIYLGSSFHDTYHSTSLSEELKHTARRIFLGHCTGRPPVGAGYSFRTARVVHPRHAEFGRAVSEAMARLRSCDRYDPEPQRFADLLGNYNGLNSGIAETILSRATISDGRSLSDLGYKFAEECGHVSQHTETMHDGRLVCRGCARYGEFARATDTGELYRTDALYRHSDGEYYTYEEEEEEDVDEDADPYRVMEYSTDVMDFLTVDSSFTTSTSGEFHMGVEFESVWTGDRSSLSRQIANHYDSGYAVAKYDGSISNSRVDGISVEWVTRPTSLAHHIQQFTAWDMSRMRAWDCKTCGMHVHVDSKAFTKSTLAKIISIYNSKQNSEFLRGIAGRHPAIDNQAREYAGLDTEVDDDEPQLDAPAFAKLWKGKVRGGQNRYTMVNLCNLGARESRRLGLATNPGGASNTVEFRVFRASTRKARVLAQLEFVHAAIVWARQAGIRECLNMEPFFRAWLASRGGYPNLRTWMQLHRRHGQRLNERAAVSLPVEAECDTATV